MKEVLLAACVAWVLAVGSALGQAAATGPRFEVATIKMAPPLTPEMLGSGTAHTGTRIDRAFANFGGVSLDKLVARAYRVKVFQVLGPGWMADARFDVLAKLPKGASAESVPEMLRALLAERFHLKLRVESRDLPVYALVFGKGGSKLLPAPTDYKQDYSTAKMTDLQPWTLEDYAMTLSDAVDRPVVNLTGLAGKYMVPMFAAMAAGMNHKFGRGGQRPATQSAPPDDSTMLAPDSDITKALIGGLKLEPRKLPMKMIVVDHLDMTPTAN